MIKFKKLLAILLSLAVLSTALPTVFAVTTADGTVAGDTVVTENAVSKISIKQTPNKLTYKVGESFDPTGLVLLAYTYSGDVLMVSDGYSVSGFDSSVAGSCYVNITYGGCTVRFSVTIEDIADSETGDDSQAGNDSNDNQTGENSTVNNQFQYTVVDDTVIITRHISNGETYLEIPSYIDGKPVTEIASQAFSSHWELTELIIPETVTTIRNSAFADCKQLVRIVIPSSVTLMEENCLPISDILTVACYEGSAAWEYCSNYGLYAEIIGTVTPPDEPSPDVSYIQSAQIKYPNRTTYYYGEEFDISDLQIILIWSDGNASIASSDMIYIEGYDPYTLGAQTVYIGLYNYEEVWTYEVEVISDDSELEIIGLEINKEPYKTEYQQGEELDTTGLEIRILTGDGSYTVITDGFKLSYFDSYQIGWQQITVYYENFSTEFSVYVTEKTSEGGGSDTEYLPLSIISLPDKTDYQYGEEFDYTGLSLSIVTASGQNVIISEGFEISGYDPYTIGEQAITVIYDKYVLEDAFYVYVDEDNTTDPDYPEEPEIPDDAAKLTIEDVTTNYKADTVTLKFTISDLPAIRSLGIASITYDTDNFELISGVWSLPSGYTMANNYGPVGSIYTATALYANDTDCNGAVFTLTLAIKDNAEPSVTDVSCTFSANDINGPLEAYVVDGTIELTEAIRGDVDGNQIVNSDDVIYLLNYQLFDGMLELVDGADTDHDYNGDNQINSDDVIYLLNHTLFSDMFELM